MDVNINGLTLEMNELYLIFLLFTLLVLIVVYKCCTNKKECSDCKCRYPKLANKNRMIKLKQKIYTLILKKTKKALARLGIPVFLSSGTCLGYFREGKFIDHDYDIDVGIFAKDYDPRLVDEMKKEGLYLYRILGNKRNGMELSFRMPNTPLGKYAKIDIFLHYLESDKMK